MSASVTPVDDATVAGDDTFATDEAGAVSGSVFADNGSGVDADVDSALHVTAVKQRGGGRGHRGPARPGALPTLNADGTFAYDPDGTFAALTAGASSTDAFTYTLNGDDPAGGDVARVTVTRDAVDVRGATPAELGASDFVS